MNIDRKLLRQSPLYSDFHKFLNFCNNSGFIYRQELVSMIPPLFLEVESTDLILDMCAAPGSKTTQILEFMQKQSEEMVVGGVLANEMDFKRAWILSHQVKKLKIPNVSIVCHPGQFLPNLSDQS